MFSNHSTAFEKVVKSDFELAVADTSRPNLKRSRLLDGGPQVLACAWGPLFGQT